MFFAFRALIIFLCSCLAGCALVPMREPSENVTTSQQMLKEQQTMLFQYAERLSELLDSHEKLNKKVELLQRDMVSTNQLLTSELKAHREAHSQEDKTKNRLKQQSSLKILPPPDKVILGSYEWVWLDLLFGTLKSRIDTGSLSSSLDVSEIQLFERDGEKWVRFLVPEFDKKKVYEAPVVRELKMRNASSDTVAKRPVVKLTVRLGLLIEETEFTLSERSGASHPVLLGRNFLRDIALVDVAKKFTQKKYTPPTANTVASP